MSGTKDQVEGTAKEAAGKVTGNDELETKGTVQRNFGKVKKGAEDATEDATDAVAGAFNDTETTRR